MVRELNFDHVKSRGISGRQTIEYSQYIQDRIKPDGGQEARNIVRKAIKEGKLKCLKKNNISCTHCGKKATIYEHRDYNFPLEVSPSCHSCNAILGKAEPVRKSPK